MLNNSSQQKWNRLEKKSLDNQFMNDIVTGVNCSPFEAKAGGASCYLLLSIQVTSVQLNGSSESISSKNKNPLI